jgi:RNA polymerase sigma-70 factor (ECF subfamily)
MAGSEPTARDDARAEAMALFEQHGAALYRFAHAMLHHSDEAADVVQDTFLRLFEHLCAGQDRSNLRAWLFTVAANGCRDRLRDGRRWLPWGPEHERTPAPAPAEADVHGERTLREAARRLAPRDRLLLALRSQGLSYREIARAAGIRETSVGRLLARAVDRWRAECRHLLGESHESLFDPDRASGAGGR